MPWCVQPCASHAQSNSCSRDSSFGKVSNVSICARPCSSLRTSSYPMRSGANRVSQPRFSVPSWKNDTMMPLKAATTLPITGGLQVFRFERDSAENGKSERAECSTISHTVTVVGADGSVVLSRHQWMRLFRGASKRQPSALHSAIRRCSRAIRSSTVPKRSTRGALSSATMTSSKMPRSGSRLISRERVCETRRKMYRKTAP